MKMIKSTFSICLILLSFFSNIGAKEKHLELLLPDGKLLPKIIEGVKYESGNWAHPNYGKPFKSLGNHRFVLKTRIAAEVVQARIPWRRPDENPSDKGLVIVNVSSGEIIKNVIVRDVNNEYGCVLFEPDKNSVLYYVYYLPHESTGSYYPKLKYLPQTNNADPSWLKEFQNPNNVRMKKVSEAEVVAAQSIDDFHSFFPMEIIATKKELKSFIKAYPEKFYLFPEFRDNPVRMRRHLPFHWIKRGLKRGISNKAKKGEFYTFQVSIFSPRENLTNVKIEFSELRSKNGNGIPQTGLECFNTSGIGLDGMFFNKKLNADKGVVRTLWFGVKIPENTNEGEYFGKVIVTPENDDPEMIDVVLKILPEKIQNGGEDKPENMSRLRWLNSRLGNDKEFIVKPFTPVFAKKNKLEILGKEIVLNSSGLPGEILSFFPEEMTCLRSVPEQVIAGPITFNVLKNIGSEEKWVSEKSEIVQEYKSEAFWRVKNESDSFIWLVKGRLEYDGMLNYEMELVAKRDIHIADIYLKIPMERKAAVYMLGLGRKGGERPDNFSWKWDVNFHHEGVWLGNINKGIQYVLRDKNYERPLNTNFYHNKPLKLPQSWGNSGKGGIDIKENKEIVEVKNYSGPREMKKGESLSFNIRFLITPFKVINIKKHFNTRFVHKYVPVKSVAELGGSVVNVHHANEINPYINYPFFNLDKQSEYIREAHKRGIKVKLYYTIRELTYKAFELFALRSLDDEILNDGEGGGHSWLQEHLRSGYHSAWHATNVNDAAILNKGTSRWTNYYIEGLNWLAKNQKIDGLYLDDIAFSRGTMKRITNVLNRNRDDVIIDLHSANQFNHRDGFINSAFLYMEHFPYISRLWFGEYFEYDLGPDYWLTEVSGIPFGLTGEMLEKGGHPFRGMVYGMTNRVYGKYNPGELWKLFDKFKIAESKMLGYWVENSPVKTKLKNVRSTIYSHKDRILIAIGSWSQKNEDVPLNINWDSLGFNKNRVRLTAPEIKGLQKKGEFDIEKPVPVEKNKGIILILEKL